jgi:transcriptional regulator with XRE-family HTH domain
MKPIKLGKPEHLKTQKEKAESDYAIFLVDIQDRLYQLMKEKNLKYTDIARALGMSALVVRRVFSSNAYPKLRDVVMIASFLGAELTIESTLNITESPLEE